MSKARNIADSELDNLTVNGRDISVDGTKLDGIETGATADQTGAEISTALSGQALSGITSVTLEAGASDWSFEVSGTDLLIKFGGATRAKLDSSGNFSVEGDVTAFASL